jgi:hypothetical protein
MFAGRPTKSHDFSPGPTIVSPLETVKEIFLVNQRERAAWPSFPAISEELVEGDCFVGFFCDRLRVFKGLKDDRE